MSPRFQFAMTEHWSPEQWLAVYDFTRLLAEPIWQEHEDELLDLTQKLDLENGHEPISTRCADNLELPFDDPIPF